MKCYYQKDENFKKKNSTIDSIALGCQISHTSKKEIIAELNELTLLSQTAGYEIKKIFIQKRHKYDPATFIGKGKIEEILSFSKINVGQALRIIFEQKEIKVPNDAKTELAKLAKQIIDKKELRIQLMAFAAMDGMSVSKARRKSLSRALSVRSFLMKNGLRSTRIDVRALGNKSTEMPLNRVDVNIAKR